MTTEYATKLREQSVHELARAQRQKHKRFADAYRQRIAFLDRIILDNKRREEKETRR